MGAVGEGDLSREAHPRARRGVVAVAAALALGTLIVPVAAAPALAHETRTIGRWRVEVGFGDEPPYAGYKNSVALLLRDKRGRPVTDLGDSLKVEVLSGDQKLELRLEPNFGEAGSGEPGDYRAWFIPTAPGRYTFHFVGTIKGDRVDRRFTSSPTTFDDVLDPAEVQFPAKDPGAGQVAQRLDREVPRLEAALASSNAAARRARDAATRAGMLAIVAAVFGVAGFAVALTVRRRQR